MSGFDQRSEYGRARTPCAPPSSAATSEAVQSRADAKGTDRAGTNSNAPSSSAPTHHAHTPARLHILRGGSTPPRFLPHKRHRIRSPTIASYHGNSRHHHHPIHIHRSLLSVPYSPPHGENILSKSCRVFRRYASRNVSALARMSSGTP